MYSIKSCCFLVVVVCILIACNKSPESNFILQGYVKDLKKGVVYLQKQEDSSIVNLDSVTIKGQSDFTLTTKLDEPLLLYLKLEKNDGNEHFIPFFADKGITELTTTLKGFGVNAEINGSAQQDLLDTYLELMSDFKNRNLDLIKAHFEAVKRNDSLESEALLQRSNRLLKLKYASTINFALNHNNSEIAPYLALYEIPDANVVYLDSIYRHLTDSIKLSYYGKKLSNALVDYKKRTEDSTVK